ncbi:Uncharacterized protein TCM_033233 isoform 5, partial [Theobroma cacao]
SEDLKKKPQCPPLLSQFLRPSVNTNMKCFETGQSSTNETLSVKRKGKKPMAPRKESELRDNKHKKHTSSKRRFEVSQNKKTLKKQKSLESKIEDLKKEMNHEELQEYQEKLGRLEQNLAEIKMQFTLAKEINDDNKIFLNSIIALLFP